MLNVICIIKRRKYKTIKSCTLSISIWCSLLFIVKAWYLSMQIMENYLDMNNKILYVGTNLTKFHIINEKLISFSPRIEYFLWQHQMKTNVIIFYLRNSNILVPSSI